ncbi:hypothetical protein C9374_000902 [Naegleria lovaniensis]|uniref:SAM domain-containing protein n=1 Tax=Naegleria lovaniensis TaxID=51637 RepID=A0AA88GW00_NAELO|nr:uncharacterized protein C9374_000902 [Naegleria lovaniensis]KAG2388052.1 hypothetical protein C9374_000902 [Naegleria lovaniensis]
MFLSATTTQSSSPSVINGILPHSCSSLIPHTNSADVDEDNASNPIADRLKNYQSIDSFESVLQLQDDELIQSLQNYLRQRKNEEIFKCLKRIDEMKREMTMTCSSPSPEQLQSNRQPKTMTSSNMYSSFSNNSVAKLKISLQLHGKTMSLLLPLLFLEFYNEFICLDSVSCVNITSRLRKDAKEIIQQIELEYPHLLNKRTPSSPSLEITSSSAFKVDPPKLNVQVTTSSKQRKSLPSKSFSDITTLRDKNSESEQNRNCSIDLSTMIIGCIDSVELALKMQFNNEILINFKKDQEFTTFLLSRVIAWSNESGVASSLFNASSTIDEILQAYDMMEYSKSFAKRKLSSVDQIKNFTTQDFKDKIGIKKVGHLKRIVRVIQEIYGAHPCGSKTSSL